MKFKRLAALLLAGVMSVSMLTGCGINKKAVVATYNSKEVTLGVANFLCRYQQAVVDDMYRSYNEDIWSQDMTGSGSSMQESMKSDLMDELHEMYTLKDHMKEYDVELSKDEKKAISEAVAAFMDKNSRKALREMGATEEIVEEVLTLYTIKEKMHDAIVAKADVKVTDEEANMRAYSIVTIDASGTYDENYQFVEYTEEEKAQKKAAAEAIAADLKDGKTLEEAAEKNGMSATTATYDADDDSLEEAVKNALDGLKEGETSDMIESEDSYTFVRIDSDHDEEATEENRKSITEEKQEEFYTETLEGWQKDDKWKVKEKQLAKIEFKNALTQKKDTEETESSELTTEQSTENTVEETVDGTETVEGATQGE